MFIKIFERKNKLSQISKLKFSFPKFSVFISLGDSRAGKEAIARIFEVDTHSLLCEIRS